MSLLDAVIIGAGYGGMGTAALLAHAGMSVVVVAQSSLVGGRASSLTDGEGYRWEYGAHSPRLAEKGIAEIGNHDQLLARRGLYWNLNQVNAQSAPN